MNPAFHWLLHTDAGLLTRVLIGSAIFAYLAVIDLQRNRRAATRWREYGVLLAGVAAALSYGVINDQVTVTLSPEYFLNGKELDKVVGDHPPMGKLRWEAAKVGLKATWTAGLIFSVMLLLANNPHREWPRLPNRRLVRYLPVILLVAACCGAIGGWLGYHGYLTSLDSDFAPMVDANMYRPQRFMAAWGVHLGGYVGGTVGTVAGVILIIRARRKEWLGSCSLSRN